MYLVLLSLNKHQKWFVFIKPGNWGTPFIPESSWIFFSPKSEKGQIRNENGIYCS